MRRDAGLGGRDEGLPAARALAQGLAGKSGDVSLEASLAAYKKGEQLLRHCKGLLDRAELSVRELSLADAEQGG